LVPLGRDEVFRLRDFEWAGTGALAELG